MGKKRDGWFYQSNRDKHFKYAILVSYVGTMLMGIGCAGGMEFKDVQAGGKWDWIDFFMTVAGSLIGQILQLLTIWLIIIIAK